MPNPWPTSLPSDAQWRYDAFFKHYWLRLGHKDIASVTPVAVGPGWIVGVNRHWAITRKGVGGKAPSAECGKKMVERWLWANLDRIQREVDALPKPRTACGHPVGSAAAEASKNAPRKSYVAPVHGRPPTPEELVELERKDRQRRRGKRRRG